MFKFLLGIMKKRKTVSSDIEVHVHPLTNSSTFAWQEIRVHQKVEKVAPMDPSTPILADHIRFVCLSDTHLKIEKGQIEIPDGDVLLHSGDFTNTGLPIEVKTFNDFLEHNTLYVVASFTDRKNMVDKSWKESMIHGNLLEAFSYTHIGQA